MAAYRLLWTQSFLRTARKFVRRHPDLEGELEAVLKQLENDPRAPRLRLHPLRGKHLGKHAVSLTYSHRIVMVLRVTRKEVVLLDIGTHDEVYRDT
ncbi:MAG: type II toxin-antitoxin system YafQ family toxin [Kiritimatiellae bacterium]|nr:type II toxin-antitoxin system YafQ family toxin [Kiritimatiellia bacterium]